MNPQYKAIYQKGKFKAKRTMNARKGEPSTKAPFNEIIVGTIIEYAGWVENGENFSSITKWFFDSLENYYWVGNCEELKIESAPPKIDEQINTTPNIKKEEASKNPIKLVHMQFYGPKSPETVAIRAYINNEFGLANTSNNLQCTEYALYRLKCSGVEVEWQRKNNRNGGLWPEAVALKYKRLNTPVAGGVICLPLSVIPGTGHVAYVEKVNSDQSINISEANWGPSNVDLGHYWERNLPLAKWRDKYKSSFIDFNNK